MKRYKDEAIKRYHYSWLLAWLSGGTLLGTVISIWINPKDISPIEVLVISASLGIVGFKNRRILGVLFVISSGLLFGLWRGGNERLNLSGYKQYFGESISVVGRVAEDPSYSIDGDLRLKLKDVDIEGSNFGGELWVSTKDKTSLNRSDKVTVYGEISKGFGTIPAALYRAEVLRVERQDYTDVARDTRDWFAEGVRNSLDEPEASLGIGFLVGQKTTLPEKLNNELRLLGLTHIVVASGYNLTILVRFARRLFAKVSRFTALAASGFMIYGFTLLTGYSPSMSRASLIAGLSLVAWYYGRKIHPMVLLPLSAAITVVINPSYAWGDIGWLLSFTSFVGVIMLGPLIQAYFWGDKKPGVVRQVVIETMSAQMLTLPIIAYVFGQYSPLSIIANALILPFIPIAMLLTFIAGFGGIVGAGVGTILGGPATELLEYMTTIIGKLALLPAASSELIFSINTLIIFYLAIVVGLVFLYRRTGHAFREYNVIE